MAGCEECRREMRWLQPAIGRLGESVERIEPGPDLRRRVVDEAYADVAGSAPTTSPQRRRLFSGWRPVTALATIAVAIVVAAGIAVSGGGDGGGEQTTVVAGEDSGVTATMVSEGERATLSLTGVPAMPPDRVLEAWVRRRGTVEPVRALFVADRNGRASTTIEDTSGVEVVMVTAEPSGGSESPTSAPMVTMDLPE
jgi:anti-sigma-K factor RskA